MDVWSSCYDHFRSLVARSLVARSLVVRSLGRSVARSKGRSVTRSLGRTVARSLDRSIARPLARSIARSIAPYLLQIKSQRGLYLSQIKSQRGVETPAKISFGDVFKSKHRSTYRLFQRTFCEKGSLWQQAEGDQVTTTAIINDLEDCRKFLLRVRRLSLVAGIETNLLNSTNKFGVSNDAGKNVTRGSTCAGQVGLWPKRQRIE